jgi:hypothetical protein
MRRGQIERTCIIDIEEHIVRQSQRAHITGETTTTRVTVKAAICTERIVGVGPASQREVRQTAESFYFERG